MLRLATQLRLRLFVLVAVSFGMATWTLWKGESIRARNDVETLLRINYRDLLTGFTDRADYQLSTIARDIANRLGTSGKLASEDIAAICREEEIAEIYDVDARGTVVGGSRIVGADMHAGEQSAFFLRLLDPDGPETLAQPDMPRTSDGKVFKYAAARFPDGSGYLEVGWSEERFLKHLRQRAYGYTRSWHIDERGFIILADSSGTVTSHADMSLAGKSLAETTGLDPGAIPVGTVFRATIAGTDMFCLAGPVRDYLAILADPADDVFASRDRFMPRIAAVQLAVFAALFFLVSRMLRKRVAEAVSRTGDALRRIAGGDLAGRADVRTSLEFAELSDNINATVDALRNAAAERVRRIEAELELGRTIQRAALPTDFPSGEGFRLDAAMQAAREVGGDFYDFFRIDGTHVAFLVADVSGKGITAALYMMTAKTLLKETLLALHDPAAALGKANAELCANNPANMFLTAWVGVLDLETGVVAYANAGHNPPVLVGVRKPDGGAGDVRFLKGKPDPVLAFADGIPYHLRTVPLAPGDALFLYTDGVTEALDSRQALFGEDRLLAAIRAVAEPDPHELCTVVRAAVAAFSEGIPQADDITVLAIRHIAPLRTVSRSFPPTREGISAAAAHLDGALADHPALAPLLPRLHIILDEIASNIVRHSGASGFVVDVTPGANGVQLAFIDDGTPYDPLASDEPDTSLGAAERPIGGLGILMVKKMASSLSYRRSRNRNCLTVGMEAPRPPAG
jgi:serine phosphatase RsbU (regulator of sigma subunit)/anti-sigma regulatory factor (Ser/Thr protein kinase)